jgi:hypothetical protein
LKYFYLKKIKGNVLNFLYAIINIALNNSTEYEGGGVRFIRKNITVFNESKGWALLHPGRVTHYHEALKITKGKRYVLISFNN